MKNFGKVLGALALAALALPAGAFALGTPAGTNITNTATANYLVGPGATRTATSNTATVTVQQVTDVVVTPLNSPITVNPGDAGRIAAFKVTNLGNGQDTFALATNSTILTGDTFDPVLSTLPGTSTVAIDTNGNGVYDPGTDTYATATTALNADAYVTVFVFNDIPTTTVNGDTGLTELTATSNTANGAVGTLVGGAGGAVVGGNGGTATARATYSVSSATVSINKTSTIVLDPYTAAPGPYQAIPGATIEYTLTVTVAGTATAQNVVITDAIPANTTYVPGSMKLNGAGLTDAADADAGDFNITNPGAITVTLGNMTSANTHVIKFRATIN